MFLSSAKYSQLSGFETPIATDGEDKGKDVGQVHSDKSLIKPRQTRSAGQESVKVCLSCVEFEILVQCIEYTMSL